MIDLALSIPLLTYATFMGAAFLLFLTPGADMMFTIASGMRGGAGSGIAAAWGISLGSLCHAAMTAAGLAVLLAAYPVVYDGIRYLGAAYLLWLAWQAWHDTSAVTERRGATEIRRAFGRAFLTNLLNPKVALFVLAFFPQFADPALGPVWQQILILGVLMAVCGGVMYSGLGAFAGLAAAQMRRASRWMGKASALVFGGLAVRIALD
ncbi:LysE family translocator [Marivita hallyeonensis]|uniref:Threonine/homoserine/homoserine lactone efflux protein n=1 Tax=Marivita hallyeonensis TaxID=996342 RepID=A0A1M5XSU7_9RHOB|nr:LysE family translocator [Marivita hallyeonensis]SHI02905.1 Threonine/homoserine/homoserine lactone efflux protein [Marivita hallyeonensis]